MAQHTSSGTRHAPAHATPRATSQSSAARRRPAPGAPDGAGGPRPQQKTAAVRRMVTTLFFLPMTALTVFSKTRASAASVLAATTAGARCVCSLPRARCHPSAHAPAWVGLTRGAALQLRGELPVGHAGVRGDQEAV